MKADEKQLLIAVHSDKANGIFPRATAERLGINEKRASYLFQKWVRRGWYDFGVAEDMGWLTEEGKAAAMRVLAGGTE